MKIAIIGAGVTGLTLARELSKKYDVSIYEKKDKIGGLVDVDTKLGGPYHKVGGHCFNSKHTEVLEYVWNLLPKDRWNKIQRNAKILIHENYTNYPIEYSIKQIAEHSPELAEKYLLDFITASHTSLEPKNLQEWFVSKFGQSLADDYFIPYNKKIWNRSPSEMNWLWVNDKLPIPDLQSVLKSLFSKSTDAMPHANFYYPKSGTQTELIDALADGLTINDSHPIFSLEHSGVKWVVNGEDRYDYIFNTAPLDVLISLISEAPHNVSKAASELTYNKVTTMLWRSAPTDLTWTYLPEAKHIFHRLIHIGNFVLPNADFTISEAVGVRSKEEMVEAGKLLKDILLEPIDYHCSEHAYVVFDNQRQEALNSIFQYLGSNNIASVGRFGEWEYYNMDICIKRALETVAAFEKNNRMY